jgi:Fe-S-cluster containining protein
MAPNRRRAERDLALLYERVPKVACKGTCHGACCFIEGTISDRERQRLQEATGETLRTIDRGVEDPVTRLDAKGNPLARWACSMLDQEGRCRAYEVRPMICRIYGTLRSLNCHEGCIPERWLDEREGALLVFESLLIGGGAPPGRTLDEVREKVDSPEMQSFINERLRTRYSGGDVL